MAASLKSFIYIFGLLLLVSLTVVAQNTSENQTDEQLINAVTTRPWAGVNFPALPNLPTSVRSNISGEISAKEVREAYLKLDTKRRNTDWFEATIILEKHKAVWSTSFLFSASERRRADQCASQFGKIKR